MRRLTQILALVAWLITTHATLAAEEQFYFVGKVVVSSAPVPGAHHVYLRWDSIEGGLPADIVNLRLLRNGDQVGEWAVNAVMPVTDIDAIYQGADHQRRKLETITRLNEIASEQKIPFSASQFARTLYDLINPASPDRYNPLWAFLGSRTDFNIARARYRAWIDTTPAPASGTNVVQYELLGVNAVDATARLGYVEIDPTTQQQALGATGLRQIRVSDWRCDLPEGSKDNYTVMLDWTPPGAGNVTDRVAAQSYLSGFDLYRTTDNIAPTETDVPVRDIAALAAAATTDSRGRPVMAGLEKVNVPLIIDSGAPSFDPEWIEARQYHIERLISEDGDADNLPPVLDDNIPMEPRWLEARDRLMRAGLKPGDRRAYYLVSRDFTGQYGPSVGAIVEVPLMARPPAPWNLRAFADETSSALNAGSDALTFTWDEVNVDNYIKMYQGTRLFCNPLEAHTTGVLEYVPLGESCATAPHNVVRMDVRDYRIYRFENFDIAGRFKDSDGDGVEDAFETPDFDGNGRVDAFERSAGLQCNVLLQPANAENYLVYSMAGGSVELGRPSLFNPNLPNIARMRDVVPAGNKDTVYWYRIVSEATTPFPVGRLSFMSAPQRGLFPDREPPLPPDVQVLKPGPRSPLPAFAGDLVPGGAGILVKPKAGSNTCVAAFESIDGTATRIGSTCDPGGLEFQARPGLFCGYAIATDENNNISTTVQFPCVLTPSQPKAPSAPQLLTFAVDNSEASFTFRLPAEQVAMAMARLNQDGGASDAVSTIEAIPVMGNESGDSMSASIPVAALQSRQDTFCLQLMSVGPDDGTGSSLSSNWSTEKCFTRTSTGEDLPEYLPWPSVQGAVQGAPLEAALVTDYLISPFLAFKLGESADLLQPFADFSNCWITTPNPEPQRRQDFYPYRCLEGGYADFQRFLEPELRFILYRQQRLVGGVASDWVQVSPLIDYAHFDREQVDIGNDNGPFTVWTLNDPYVKALADEVDPSTLNIWFVDQYPFQWSADVERNQLFEWRYQAVYFDAGHHPVRWRASNWFRDGNL